MAKKRFTIKTINLETLEVQEPQTNLIVLEDITSNAKDARKTIFYAKAGDEVKLLSDKHGDVLLVEIAQEYKISKTERGTTSYIRTNKSCWFPVHKDKTNYGRPDAKPVLPTVPDVPPEERPTERTKLYSSRKGQKRK